MVTSPETGITRTGFTDANRIEAAQVMATRGTFQEVMTFIPLS
jgi:hypothetical protein